METEVTLTRWQRTKLHAWAALKWCGRNVRDFLSARWGFMVKHPQECGFWMICTALWARAVMWVMS